MNETASIKQPTAMQPHDLAPEPQDATLEPQAAPQELHETDNSQEGESGTADRQETVAAILKKMGVSDSIATTARTIIDSLETSKTPGENFVRLIVNALNHDEDVKNAEATGYLRGRNEVIEVANHFNDEMTPKPVNFPVYRKRSFWD